MEKGEAYTGQHSVESKNNTNELVSPAETSSQTGDIKLRLSKGMSRMKGRVIGEVGIKTYKVWVTYGGWRYVGIKGAGSGKTVGELDIASKYISRYIFYVFTWVDINKNVYQHVATERFRG